MIGKSLVAQAQGELDSAKGLDRVTFHTEDLLILLLPIQCSSNGETTHAWFSVEITQMRKAARCVFHNSAT